MQPASARATARAAFSGPLDPATVTRQTVVAIDLVTRMPLPSVPTVDPADPSAILISPIPGATWPLGHRIAIAVIGYPVGVQGEGGVPVVASPAFYFARGANPVATCATASPDCQSTTPALQQQQAIGLEQLRQALAPVIEGLVAAGFPRDALAIVWTFTVGAP